MGGLGLFPRAGACMVTSTFKSSSKNETGPGKIPELFRARKNLHKEQFMLYIGHFIRSTYKLVAYSKRR